MSLDPNKLFDVIPTLIKDNDDKAAAAFLCGMLLLAGRLGWLPPLPDLVKTLAWCGLFFFGGLIGLKLLGACLYAAVVSFLNWNDRRKAKRRTRPI
jgi:hypothetical protein